jgi:Mg2+-importing ATPase
VLNAGDVVPGDGRILSAANLLVDEATQTGESFPAEKSPGDAPAEAPLSKRINAVFMGSHVASGSGLALMVRTGSATEFGRIAGTLS